MTSKGYVERRQKIIDAICNDWANGEIVAAFGCSMATVTRCRRKLGIKAPIPRSKPRGRRNASEFVKRCERCGAFIVTDSCLRCWLKDGHGDRLFKRLEDDEENKKGPMPFDIKGRL